MKQRFGHRGTLALELGSPDDSSPDLRTVDVFAAGQWLTCDDNVVYLPQFIASLNTDLDRAVGPPCPRRDALAFPALSPVANHEELLRIAREDNDLHLLHRFMDWGPTADNVSMHLFRSGGVAHLPFSFWRESHHDPSQLGTTFCAQLPDADLRVTLHGAAWQLMWDWQAALKQHGR